MTTEIFQPYECSHGTVVAHDHGSYLVLRPSGEVEGFRANGEPSEASVEADLANPPAPAAQPLRQSARTVLERLTTAEKAALRGCTIPAIQDAYDAALIEGVISEADHDFPAFRTALDQLGIISANRWPALLAP